jgi:hypothetical protein
MCFIFCELQRGKLKKMATTNGHCNIHYKFFNFYVNFGWIWRLLQFAQCNVVFTNSLKWIRREGGMEVFFVATPWQLQSFNMGHVLVNHK